jgi:precorrin-6Y C5,15-methyltransferase (decarboxylating)
MDKETLGQKWLSIVGLGEDGLDGISAVGRSLIQEADLIVGGERHLAMLSSTDSREKWVWSSPIQRSIDHIISQRGRSVCVLGSGDPMCYGIGTTLIRQIPLAEMLIVPAPSAFSLACARLGWSITQVETISLCGRDPAFLRAVLYPGAQILALSADRHTPIRLAHLLTETGWGESSITVLERMGGTQERWVSNFARDWQATDLADLNLVAITCPSALAAPAPLSRLAGLPDSAYCHDGQLTKQEVRAVTLAALAPLPKQLLWDVGAGCGSIGIEWMRSDCRCQAIAIESHPTRIQYIADNAQALGVPNLQVIAGEAPAVLLNLPQPDAIFVGGGLTAIGLIETCWQALPVGGRLVANAVTVAGEQQLFQWQQQLGGNLSRIAIQRAEPVGQYLGWKAMAPVTQWTVVRS